jgi:isopentenyl diphosphate isomerase/L-lactate dehydrogenase-like FMN-dependent dehydrogenase
LGCLAVGHRDVLAAGEPGVRRILELFRGQIDSALAFLGASTIGELDRSLLDTPQGWPARGGAFKPRPR